MNVLNRTYTKRHWLGHWPFMLAAIGFSVGLANIWKFPYEMGLHGGGGFLLVYVLSMFLLGLPLVLAELMLGRRGGRNTVASISHICKLDGVRPVWKSIAFLGLFACVLLFVCYSVIASWILFYMIQSFTGAFQDAPAEVIQHSFSALLLNREQMLLWQTAFVISVASILARDLRWTLRLILRWLMPGFIVVLVWLSFYANFSGDVGSALQFIFRINMEALSVKTIVSAINQSLFSMGIGAGMLMLYGANFSEDRPFFAGSLVIFLSNIGVVILTTIFVFSIVFAYGMRVDGGSGLLFQALPVAFSKLSEYNVLWSSLFFVFLLLCALISSVALLEPIIAYLSNAYSIKRSYASWFTSALVWLLGWVCIFSFSDDGWLHNNLGENFLGGMFDTLVYVLTQFVIPLLALLISIFVAWKSDLAQAEKVLSIKLPFAFYIWKFCLRYITVFIISFSLIFFLYQQFFGL